MRSKSDKQQDCRLLLLRPFIKLWMWVDARRRIKVANGFSLRRKEPYILLANHTTKYDFVHIAVSLKKVPFIITNEILLTKPFTRFLLTKIAHVIPKSKGRSDAIAVLEMMKVMKRGYPVMLFPEGDRTFYGSTGDIDLSIMKFIKKMNVDVVTVVIKEGFLSQPRWASGKRKNRRIEMNFSLALKADDVKTKSVEEIDTFLKQQLAYNAYEDQKIKRISHPGKHLTEGLENAMYVCPFCQGINTLKTTGNQITCQSCHHEGWMDEFGFIHDFVYDNLVDWDVYQRQFKEKLLQAHLETSATLSFIHSEKNQQETIGEVQVTYDKGWITLQGAYQETIEASKMQGVALVFKQSLAFIYEERYYILQMKQYGSSFLRVLQDRF